MRLSELERQEIREAAFCQFGTAPRLLGSRLDEHRRGGDFGLLMEARLPPEQAVRRQ